MQISVETAICNASASLNMEGMQPSPEVLLECRHVLNGKITHEQYISMVRERFMETNNVKVQP